MVAPWGPSGGRRLASGRRSDDALPGLYRALQHQVASGHVRRQPSRSVGLSQCCADSRATTGQVRVSASIVHFYELGNTRQVCLALGSGGRGNRNADMQNKQNKQEVSDSRGHGYTGLGSPANPSYPIFACRLDQKFQRAVRQTQKHRHEHNTTHALNN